MRAASRERRRDEEERLEAEFRARQQEAVQKAKNCLTTYGEFADHKQLLRAAIADPAGQLVKPAAIRDVLQSVEYTDRKFQQRLREVAFIKKTAAGVDWGDDEVVSAIEHLTKADDDHAAQLNKCGWSKAHSSNGHWCRVALSDHRAEAIKLARTILGGYRKQLVGARILKARAA